MNLPLEHPWRPALPLATQRLLLRPHSRADLDDLFAFHSNPEVVRYVPWPVRTLEETRVALEAKLDRYEVTEEGQWLILAIELRSDSRVIGEVLLKNTSVQRREGELGFALHADYQGKGFAFEAATAVLDFAFGAAALLVVTATLDARNTASAALLERLGMTLASSEKAVFKGETVDELTYRMAAPADRRR
jgi:RimJ/RimL family protein N-acetyltransferase